MAKYKISEEQLRFLREYSKLSGSFIFEDDENELNSVEITSFLSEYYLIYIDKLPNAELF